MIELFYQGIKPSSLLWQSTSDLEKVFLHSIEKQNLENVMVLKGKWLHNFKHYLTQHFDDRIILPKYQRL
jgi:hypothetical protein